MNYRSVVVLTNGRRVEDRIEKNRALHAMVEHIIPGRSSQTRMPTENELDATAVVAFSLKEASAKIRTGPPGDLDEDLSLPHWAGVIPLHLQAGKAMPDERLAPDVRVPHNVCHYRRSTSIAASAL